MSDFHSFFESLRFHTGNTWKCIKIEWRIRNKLKRSWPVTNATNLWTVWSCCGDSPWRHSQSCQDRPSSTSILSQQDLCDAWRGEKNKREDYDVTCKRPGCQALFKMATSVVELLAYLKTMTESQVTRWVSGHGKSVKLSRILLNGAVRNCIVSGTYFPLKIVRACIFK